MWAGKDARIVYGTAEASEQKLDAVVAHAKAQLQAQIPAHQQGKPITIKLDDPAEAFVFALAAQSLTASSDEKVQLVAQTSSLPDNTKSSLVLAASDLAATIPTLCGMSTSDSGAKRHLLVLPTPVLGKQLDLDPVRKAGWTTSLIQPFKNGSLTSTENGTSPSASNSQSMSFVVPSQPSVIHLSKEVRNSFAAFGLMTANTDCTESGQWRHSLHSIHVPVTPTAVPA